jgi:hypothetical protein
MSLWGEEIYRNRDNDLHCTSGEISCTPCPIGTYSDVTGAAVCKVCQNSINTDVGQTECESCEKGTRPNADKSECDREYFELS